MTSAIMVENFALARYIFELRALDELQLPPMKGSALRGGFGHTLKSRVCTFPQYCDKACMVGNACPYGYIFETAPPPGSAQLKNLSDVSRPFVLETPTDKRTRIAAGETMTFGLTLIGDEAIKAYPIFYLILEELGEIGLGRSNGKYRIDQVKAIMPDGKIKVIADHRDDMWLSVNSSIRAAGLKSRIDKLPRERITLNFLTPTRLRQRGRRIKSGPPFEVLIRTLLARISSLSYFPL